MRPPDLSKYIGRPYEEYNCLDLVKEIYKDIFNLQVKDYYEGQTPDRRDVTSLIATNRGDFQEVKGAPRFGDLVLIRLYGLECHIGVYVDRQFFVHSIRGTGSSLDRLSRYRKMIAGYYRHREIPA